MAVSDLPTKAQIAALTDRASLLALRDDVDKAALHIQAQLDNLDGDDDWRRRAAGALAAHRFTERLIARRLASLGKPAKANAVRPPADCTPLTTAALKAFPQIDPEVFQTVEACDQAFNELTATINAMAADRCDEIAMPAADRDEAFLAATGAALPSLRGLRQRIQIRRGQISKAAKAASHQARDQRRECLFIDAAREILPKETYEILWARVDRQEAEAVRGH